MTIQSPGDYPLVQKRKLTARKKLQIARQRGREGATPRSALAHPPSAKILQLQQQTNEDRDSLTRLHHRGVILRREYHAGQTYRRAFSADAAAGVAIQSNINPDSTGGSSGTRTGQPPVQTAYEAKAMLFWLRWVVLGGQVDAVGIMDAVCGKGLSLAQISRGNDRIAGKLETALRIALGQCATALENKGKNAVADKKQA